MVTRAVYTHEPGSPGKLISQHRSGTTSYYLYDGLGSTRALADGSGTITDTYVYQTYGAQISETGSTPNNYRYVGRYGYYYDRLALSVPLYVRVRNLSTTQARFVSADPSGITNRDLNLYSYVRNNPVNLVDSTGTTPCPPSEWRKCAQLCRRNTPPNQRFKRVTSCDMQTIQIGRTTYCITWCECERRPKDCTEKVEADLTKKYKVACAPAPVGPAHCHDGMTDQQLIENMQKFTNCAAARTKINQVCFFGGDYGHLLQVLQNLEGATNCLDILLTRQKQKP